MAPELTDGPRLLVLTRVKGEAILREAGFSDARMFYTGLRLRAANVFTIQWHQIALND